MAIVISTYSKNYINQTNMLVLNCTFIDWKCMHALSTDAAQINKFIAHRRCVSMHLLCMSGLHLWNEVNVTRGTKQAEIEGYACMLKQ